MCKFVSLYLIHASTGKGRGEGEGDGSGEGEGEGGGPLRFSLSLVSRRSLKRQQQFPGTPGSFGTDTHTDTQTHTHTNKSFISIDVPKMIILFMILYT